MRLRSQMPHTFFNSWQLWEKMTFVLACAIALTCVAGAIRLAYIRWKLRKYHKRLKEDPCLKLEANPPALPVSSVVPIPRDKAPFGIRAIESGIEVDGIWISRPSSPVPSFQESTKVPLLKQTSSESANELHLAPPQSLPSRVQIGRSTSNLSSHSLSNGSPATPRSLLSLSPMRMSVANPVQAGGPESINPGFVDTPTFNPDNGENSLEDLFERRRLAHSASSGQLTGRSRPASDDSKSTNTSS